MLACGSCGAESPDGTRFCRDCGTSLVAACPECGSPSPGGFRFCGDCGASLGGAPRASRPGPASTGSFTERRVCSVLFADLVDFTPLTEARDPEEVRDLLSEYFETARTIIGRYGGVVEKFIGDAVMAVWGTPVVTEGDAERAVRAAMDLTAAIEGLGELHDAPALRLRAGVVTGEVAATIGAVGQGMVAGEAVNTAARVQTAAAPGTVWVDAATRRTCAAAIGFQEVGAHRLKGRSEPVELWQATRVLGNVGGGRRSDGLEAPMVGRAAEERTLRELFHAAVDRRTPRLVVVSGPPGIGKSRLGWEFEKYVDGLAFDVNWHRGRCLSYGDGVAYWALASAVRQRFGIAEEAPVDVATAALLSQLPGFVPDPTECAFVGVRLARLLGLRHPDDAGTELSSDELHAGWRLFFERLADQEPVVLLIEDAQHADAALLQFVESMVDWSRTSPICVVLFARGELVEQRPALALGRNRLLLTLDTLDDEAMATMVRALIADLPDAAVAVIAGHAQGNPLFAVETIRSLIDRDAIVTVDGELRLVGDLGELTVPDSLHGLLSARLDALDPDLRSLVCDGAVLGSSFPLEALASMSHRSAADVAAGAGELVRRGVLDISTDPLSPQRGEYAFAQPLLRQVAYDVQSRRDRRARHMAAAEHLRQVFPADGEEVMDVVAQHYLDALACSTESEQVAQLRESAGSCLVRAAERSRRSGAQHRAGTSYRTAAELVAESDPVEAARLWHLAAEMLSDTSSMAEAEAAAREAARLHEELGLTRDRARSLAVVGRTLRRRGRLAESEVVLGEVLTVLRPEPDLDTLAALYEATTAAAFGGKSVLALALSEELMELAQRLDTPAVMLSRSFLAAASAYSFMERRHEAICYYEYATRMARQAGSLYGEAHALLNLAGDLGPDDPDAGCATAERAAELCRGMGLGYFVSAAVGELANSHLLAGRWGEASRVLSVAIVDDGLDEDPSTVLPFDAVRALLGGERLEGAAPLREAFVSSDDVQDLAMLYWYDGTVAAAEGDPATALSELRLGFAEGFPTGWGHVQAMLSWPLAVRCATELGDLESLRWLVDRLDAQPVGMIPERLRVDRAHAGLILDEADGVPAADVAASYAVVEQRARALGDDYRLAHLLLDRAAHLDRHADELPDDAGEQVLALRREASALAQEVGTSDLLRRVDAEGLTLQPAGRTPHRSSVANG